MLRVLIIRPGALGDTLMLLPALKDLSGKVRITLVGRQPGLDFLRPYVDCLMDLEGSGWHRLFMDPPDERGLPVSTASSVIAFFKDEHRVIRHNLEHSLPGADIHVFRSVPFESEQIHVAEHLARRLASAGLPVNPRQCMDTVKRGILRQETTRSEGRRAIVFHPGSGSVQKNHPPGFWIDLMSRFRQDLLLKKWRHVLLLGPAEQSLHPFFAQNFRPEDGEMVRSRDTDLLLRTLDRAALYVGHDSGVTHLSAMRCVPTVALFKDSDAAQWAPLGPYVRLAHGRQTGPGLIDEVLCAARDLVFQGSLSGPERSMPRHLEAIE